MPEQNKSFFQLQFDNFDNIEDTAVQGTPQEAQTEQKPQYNEKRYAVMLIVLVAVVLVLIGAVLISPTIDNDPVAQQERPPVQQVEDESANSAEPEPEPTPVPEQTSSEISVPLGEYASLEYTGSLSNIASSDESIVTVSGTDVRGVALGDATVTANTANGTKLEWKVSVKKVAYLTINNWPGENTQKILDVLDQYGVKATFFLCAQTSYHDMYLKIGQGGHSIANHTFSPDTSKIYNTCETFMNSVHSMDEWLLENFEMDTQKLLRFPTGSQSDGNNEKYLAYIYLEREGYRIYDWSATFGDSASNATAQTCYENIVQTCTDDREIILMHHKEHSAEALPSIIEYLRSQGYEFSPITPTSPIYNFQNGWSE